MTDAIVIRTAHDGDRDFIVSLVPSLLEFGSPIWQDVNGLSPSFSDVLVQAVVERDPRAAVLVAETAESTRLGFISLSSKTLSGAGRALMGAAKGWARDRGLGILSLDVWATNHRGLAFYRALGHSVDVNAIRRGHGGADASPPSGQGQDGLAVNLYGLRLPRRSGLKAA